MPEKIRKPQHDRSGAPAPGSVEEYNANHLSASAGHPLHMPDGLRAQLEARTGVDLGNIQMRESGQPESIGARAFTRGNVIDFAPGEFRPGTEEGEALIGHEVSHVLQQASGQVHADTGASPVNADPALEHAADMGVRGGMESVPSMSYAASPVQGAFGGLGKKLRGLFSRGKKKAQPRWQDQFVMEAAAARKNASQSLSARATLYQLAKMGAVPGVSADDLEHFRDEVGFDQANMMSGYI